MSATKLNDLGSRWVKQATAISDRSGTRSITETYTKKLTKRVVGHAIKTARKLWRLDDE